MLWGLAENRCSFPDCRTPCVIPATDADRPTVIGKIAHIVAHSDEGPRSEPGMPPEDRDRYENWILLCPTHHDLVDGQPSTYSAENLRCWKSDHERWVQERRRAELVSVSFAELEIVTRGIVNTPAPPATDFRITDPRKKMSRNRLTDRVHFELSLALSKAKEVGAFVEQMAVLDPEFPERLKAGFVAEYDRLRTEGIDGDALFEALRDFSSSGFQEFKYRAAGVAVLSYLFEKCEVFES